MFASVGRETVKVNNQGLCWSQVALQARPPLAS
jgi:hypothetical protein